MGRPRKAAPLRPKRGTAVDDGSAETPPRHTASADGAKPKHGVLARCEYSLLAPTGTAVDPANVGDPGSAASHGASGKQGEREPEEGDET